MKKILLFIIFLIAGYSLNAQHDNTPAAQLAHHIADKMADTLGLTNQQRAKIFTINMDLYKKKTEARKRSTDRNVVGQELQRIEGTRNDLYKEVLTAAQHALYLQKKRQLITSN